MMAELLKYLQTCCIQQFFKDSKTSWDEKTYWESKNVIYPKTQKEENPLQFTRSN